jgi:hypothetical protein
MRTPPSGEALFSTFPLSAFDLDDLASEATFFERADRLARPRTAASMASNARAFVRRLVSDQNRCRCEQCPAAPVWSPVPVLVDEPRF